MINWEADIIPHFSLGEAVCPCCNLAVLDEELLRMLHKVRSEFGAGIVVSSWTRCQLHNAEVEGSSRSYHLNGRAVDIRPLYGSAFLGGLEAVARKHFPYVLPYDSHLHCDARGGRP